MDKKFDFSGWATRVNLKCSDGRVIMKDAFKHCDGITVPMVWNHQHNSSLDVLGHAILEHRDDGVYAYGVFNDTESGQAAKVLVQNGDVTHLSIYANKLKQEGCNVIHGMIREVSLVLAGANPGAVIDSVIMHGDDSEAEGYIYTDECIENVEPLFHADKEEEKGDKEMAEETKKTEATAEKEQTVQDVVNTMNDDQKKALYYLVAMAAEDASTEKDEDEDEEDVKHAEEADETYEDLEGGEVEMKHNVFDQETNMNEEVLSHSEMKAIFEDAKRNGSLKDAVIAHGIEDIEVMFPDHKSMDKEPGFIKRNDDWVAKVLGGVHHTPFSRIKSIFADITAAQARAKGYTKGKQKIEEVFKLLKRTTNPTTVYKKQKLDRDDMLDITDFNILPWLKGELRMMLNEELARAFLIGDGRNPVDEADDKIDEECIRPIWKMEDLFTVKKAVEVTADMTAEERAKAFIKATVKSRKDYKGSGNPVMFMSEDMLTDCMLLEDANQRVIYDTEAKLAAALRVREIIPVPVMEGEAIKRTDDDGNNFELAGIYVNLSDYNVGTDKGGEINFFDDFDIDYNQYKYLMETRCSGTLVKPHSAVAIEFKTVTA